MMIDEMVKNNKIINIVKNVILSFFALVFVLGFFSKSTINLMLPKVHAIYPMENKSIEKTVKVDGIIKPVNTCKIRLDRNIIVQEYFVKVGDKVVIGAPIFRINKNYGGDGNSERIEEFNLQLQELQIQLAKLEDSATDIGEKYIKVFRNKIENAQEEVENQEILFEAGAISKSEFEESKLQLEEQIISFETSLLNFEKQKKDNDYSADKLKSQIKKIEQDIGDLKAQEEFYANIDQDGVCYAENEGVILAVSETDIVLSKDAVITEIGVIDGIKSIKFVAQIDENDLGILEEVGFIEVTNGDNSKNRISITKISKILNGSKLQLEGQFIDEVNRNIIIDEKIQGIAAKKYESKEFHSIPKAAIIPKEELEEGKLGSVFMIEEKEGVLGDEIIAKEIEVKIRAVGDDQVIIEGLESYKKTQLINNLSYKIKDGVRVCLWE